MRKWDYEIAQKQYSPYLEMDGIDRVFITLIILTFYHTSETSTVWAGQQWSDPFYKCPNGAPKTEQN